MKKIIILTAFLVPALLVGCSDPAQVKKERCTEISNSITDHAQGRIKLTKEEHSKTLQKWKDLKCHRSDLIHG
jgi:hypothetical protein